MARLTKMFWIPFLLLALMSCGRDNPLAPQQDNGGIRFTEDKILLPDGEYIYRQGIGATISGEEDNLYSFRITTLSGETPSGYAIDADGWLWFRVPGADQSIPLDQPGEHRTIWTEQRSVSFDWTSSAGKLADLVTKAEIRTSQAETASCSTESAFRSTRIIGSRINVPFANGETTGTGIAFDLQEIIGDIFVEGLYADHFMFRLNIVNSAQGVITAGAWHSSLESPDLRKVTLNGSTSPAITTNQDGQYTQFESYVVSRQGIEEATHRTVYFHAVAGNKPKAFIYPQVLAALGQYHYSISPDNSLNGVELIPTTTNHKNRLLWSTDTGYAAINSADFRLHLRWGYRGQYLNSNPFDTEYNECVDAITNEPYYSKIVAYDLRLNNAPFPSLSQFFDPQTVTHAGGTNWLRIKNMTDQDEHCILSNLPSGNMLIQVCAVDLQGVYSDPAEVNINMAAYTPLASRSGILIVDDSVNHTAFSPETYVDGFYTNVVPTAWGQVTTVDVNPGTGSNILISPAILQAYKAVLWHSDNPAQGSNLNINVDALDIYLGNQGNLVVSSTHNLAGAFSNMQNSNSGFLENRLGIGNIGYYGYLSSSMVTNPFFIQALGQDDLPDIDLNISTAFNPLITSRQGLSTITYFNPNSGLDFTYAFGCKPVNATAYPPTQAQYDLYSSKFVGYKYSQNGSHVVLFGFPLSYMEEADVAAALQEVLNDMLGSKLAWGGEK
jgi:hypothetical protein